MLDTKKAKAPVSGYGVGMVGAIIVYEQKVHFFMHALKQFIGSASVSLTAKSPAAMQTRLNFS